MNRSEYTYLLQNLKNIDLLKIQQLEDIVTEFPYFQSARTMLLKGLNKTNSYKYNPTLKKTAAYTIDRKVLFNFITSPAFIKNTTKNIEFLEGDKTETVKELHENLTALIPEKTTKEGTQKATEILEIGKPIKFNNSESHSFNEWMQLIVQKPIVREKKTATKFSIIDTFIETNPKIKPLDKEAKNFDISSESSTENDSLMTETLAKVYLEQKKYENAIKAYHILSLKYPEKSGFFADRIKAIKILQKK